MSSEQGHIWHPQRLGQEKTILCGSTDKSFGLIRFGLGDLSDQEIVANRKKLAQAAGFDLKHVVFTRQVHGDQAVVASEKNLGTGTFALESRSPQADALITNQPELVLIIKTADCVPVFFYDPIRRAIGVAHSGWKGTALNIAQKTMRAMSEHFQSNPAEMLVAVGPSIRACHYDVSEVKDDRVKRFKEQFGKDTSIIVRHENKVALDCAAACHRQCLEGGVKAENVEVSPICTFEDPSWPSYRRQGEDLLEDIWSYIMLKHQ